jgi:hypothetical protein
LTADRTGFPGNQSARKVVRAVLHARGFERVLPVIRRFLGRGRRLRQLHLFLLELGNSLPGRGNVLVQTGALLVRLERRLQRWARGKLGDRRIQLFERLLGARDGTLGLLVRCGRFGDVTR